MSSLGKLHRNALRCGKRPVWAVHDEMQRPLFALILHRGTLLRALLRHSPPASYDLIVRFRYL